TDVRKLILEKGKHKCVFCGSEENLTIDHIISVYRAAVGSFPIEKLNIRENLQLLCLTCNSRKAP
ncbi:MAG: HNH endonuclease, partial [Nanoarchaeota archaeon]|nr:HNH endonuclease [Nanoarchaeota archaeon]